MKSIMLKKVSGDQNFIGSLILIIVAVTIGVLYRNQLSSVMNDGINKVSSLVNGLFSSMGTVNTIGS